MLNFYTEISLITEENRKRIFPLLLDVFYLKNHALEHFKYVDTIERAQVCIFSIDISYLKNNKEMNQLNNFLSNAKIANKKVWLYSGGDFGKNINMKNVITFRLGGFHTKLNNHTQIMPSFIGDVYKINFSTTWQPINKIEKPSIGFVGNANGSLIKLLKEFLIFSNLTTKKLFGLDKTDIQFFFPSSRVRYKLLKQIESNQNINSNFIYRKKYRAGANTEETKKQTTLEFYQNMYNNIYTFCLRGSGNFSVRFYETLMMGRIPLLIDTDVRLPLENVIAWENHCIKASENNFIEKLLEFHSNHTNEELIEIQKSNRILAKQVLGRIVYFVEVSKNKNIS